VVYLEYKFLIQPVKQGTAQMASRISQHYNSLFKKNVREIYRTRQQQLFHCNKAIQNKMTSQVKQDPSSHWIKFLSHNFEQDEQWKQYETNLTFPNTANLDAMVAKYKIKYYKKNIDPEFPFDSLPQVPYPLTVIKPRQKHIGTLIFLHGLGDSGDAGWFQTWNMLHTKYLQGLKIILPSALSQRVTLNMGMSMPAWYDIYGLTPDAGEDSTGIEIAKQNIHNLIYSEIIQTGIKSDRIILGGFSQGGSIALYSGYTCLLKLAGVIAMSSFVVQREHLAQALKEERNPNRSTALFMIHGKMDPVVQYAFGKLSFEFIAKHLTGQKIWKEYDDLEHCASPETMKDAVEFINKVALSQ